MECGLRALQELILLVRAREKQKIGRLAMNTNYKDKKTISGNDQEAFDEFLAGKERWNAYVEKHGDDTEVDFSGVDFPEHRKDVDEMYRQEGKPFDFSGYKFPKKGNVDFSDANFGKGDVNFWDAKFGKGDVNFNRAIFGEKEECSDQSSVNFTGATFGEGNISFLGSGLNLCFCMNIPAKFHLIY
ncbi:hypothetical protein BJAS_P3379 [Bathymodiolus japonicus methanotrophic gill symbiont]|uniref:hypothetical protein n=1 Tax=Bathymodiolus japonicus methanotrophic gill symbiont TaxID=113269 RepID=UPI001B4BA370|nr:hypothetical protein [Bathymodiolus japonicus methanotrophic gill symbiont]GFO72848.1 hypothetical protein BJAS_P3379 [Bathymodiolus japonicus methanotrophic gill symbiont]